MDEIERVLHRSVIDKDGDVGVFVFYPGDEGGAFGRGCEVAATVNDAGQRLFGEVAGAGDDAGAVVLELGDKRRADAGSAAGDEDGFSVKHLFLPFAARFSPYEVNLKSFSRIFYIRSFANFKFVSPD